MRSVRSGASKQAEQHKFAAPSSGERMLRDFRASSRGGMMANEAPQEAYQDSRIDKSRQNQSLDHSNADIVAVMVPNLTTKPPLAKASTQSTAGTRNLTTTVGNSREPISI